MDKEKNMIYVYYSLVLIGAALLVGLLALVFLPQTAGQAAEEAIPQENSSVLKQETGSGYENLAECLTANGAVLYGASWCPHCRNQKALFGDSVQYIKYVECQAPEGGQTKECSDAGISAYPTWIINGKKYVGEKSLEELARLTGCTV